MLHRVSLVIDGVLLVDGLELNRQKQGGLRLHFPARPSNRARGCACIAPYNDGVRDAIENAVLHALAERDRTR
jgi:DNA-binding cell septation regulator SpoVG